MFLFCFSFSEKVFCIRDASNDDDTEFFKEKVFYVWNLTNIFMHVKDTYDFNFYLTEEHCERHELKKLKSQDC